MSDTRYILTVDKDGTQGELGPAVVSPSGGILFYWSMTEACEKAKAIVETGTVHDVYVMALRPIAVYMRVPGGAIPVLPESGPADPTPTEN